MIAVNMNNAGWSGTARFASSDYIFDELNKRDIRFVVATGNEIPDANLFGPELANRITCRSQWHEFSGEDKIVEQHWDSHLVQDV